jgi:hypothetical protein
MLRAASSFSVATALLLAASAAAWLAVVVRVELFIGYEQAAPSLEMGDVIGAVVLIALSHLAPPWLFARSTRRLRQRTALVFTGETSYRCSAPAEARPIDEAAWHAARETRARGAAAAGLAAIVLVALEGVFVFLGQCCFHCHGDLTRPSILDANLYVALACLAAISHVFVALGRRRGVTASAAAIA